MKHILIILFAATAFFSCKENGKGESTNMDSLQKAQAEQEKLKSVKDSANFTTIKWIDNDSISKDMGKVKKGQTIEITYHFKNTGDKPLVIASVQPGCGCTVAEKPEKPVAAGDDGKIIAKFNTENQSAGSHQKNIIVKANTKPFTDHVLVFKADVVDAK